MSQTSSFDPVSPLPPARPLMPPPAPTAPRAAGVIATKFPRDGQVHAELRREVDAYFAEPGRSRRDVPAMARKTVILFAWFIAAWVGFVLGLDTPWIAAPCAIALGLAVAGIGFSVQHDANHGATSERAWKNRALGWTLDLLGGSSFVWRHKHNVVHHTYTNIDGHDDDLDAGPLARLSPLQERRPWHRLQHLYLWPFYGLIHLKWLLIDDFANLATGTVGSHKLPRPRGADVVQLVVGKLFAVTWLVVVPLVLRPAWSTLVYCLLVSATTGIVSAITFQLAHVVREAEFVAPVPVQTNDWAVHQIHTTVDFAPKSRVLTWYMGGLNFQVEHHLFPKICHVHYPALAEIVTRVSARHGVTHRVAPTFWGALASHYRILADLGRPLPATTRSSAATPAASPAPSR